MQYSSRAADRESEVFGKLFGIAELHIYLLYYIQILYIIAYNIAIIYCKKMDMSIHICKKQKNAGGQPAFFVCRFLKLRHENGFFLVEVTGLEPAASCSQSRRATNCATPRSI